MLAALRDSPTGRPRAYVLFAHCFTCGKDIFAASRISAALVEHGFSVLRFDFTGLGMSEGEFANTNFSSNVADLVKAADYLRAEYAPPPHTTHRPQPGWCGCVGRGGRNRRGQGRGDDRCARRAGTCRNAVRRQPRRYP
ncbi:MAG: alpha/beta hydrolase [Salinisphaera sp.]|nr:alpha/beta hydrolase [Salinisphaera sp.]